MSNIKELQSGETFLGKTIESNTYDPDSKEGTIILTEKLSGQLPSVGDLDDVKEIEFPDDTSIYFDNSSDIFDSCDSLDTIKVKHVKLYYPGIDTYYATMTRTSEGVIYSDDYNYLFHFPKTVTGSYVVNSSCKAIDINSFQNSKLTSITLPEGLESIGYYSFSGSSLESISFPSTIKKSDVIEGEFDSSFRNCTSLVSADFSKISLDSISLTATFSFCTELESVQFPPTTMVSYTSTFNKCSKLKLTELSNFSKLSEAFVNCSSIGPELTLNLKEGLEGIEISEECFSGCSGLTKLIIKGGHTIGNPEFNTGKKMYPILSSSGLTEVEIDAKFTYSDNSTEWDDCLFDFENVSEGSTIKTINLSNLDVYRSPKIINQKYLSSLSYGDNMKELGNIKDCPSLEKIIIPGNITKIGAISGCDSLKVIDMTALTSVPEIGFSSSDLPDDCIIYVNSNKLEEFKSSLSDLSSKINTQEE